MAPVTSVIMPDIAAGSYGGFALYFEGSGAFSVECFSPRRLADSSAGAELIMATWAGKSVVAFQILFKELGMSRMHPTPLQIDASAVTDGVLMERVSRAQRFQSARLAMLRSWQEDRVLTLLKTHTDDMRADILSKPVNPSDKFGPKQRLLLTGSSALVSRSPSSPPRVLQLIRCPASLVSEGTLAPVIGSAGALNIGCGQILAPSVVAPPLKPLPEPGKLVEQLCEAASTGYVSYVHHWLDNGADFSSWNHKGLCALHAAASGGEVRIVRILLDRGADPNQRDRDGMLPGWHCAGPCSRAIHELLGYVPDPETDTHASLFE